MDALPFFPPPETYSFLPLCYHSSHHQPHIFSLSIFPIGSTAARILQSTLIWIQHMPGPIASGPPPPARCGLWACSNEHVLANSPTSHTKRGLLPSSSSKSPSGSCVFLPNRLSSSTATASSPVTFPFWDEPPRSV